MYFLLCFSVCQDLQDEILCSEAKKAGNCEQMPWNGKCRKTCGRCGTFINTLQGLEGEWGGREVLIPYSRSLLPQSLFRNF